MAWNSKEEEEEEEAWRTTVNSQLSPAWRSHEENSVSSSFFHPTGRMFKHLQTFRIIPVSAAFERLLTQHLKLLFTLGDEAQPDGSLLFL